MRVEATGIGYNLDPFVEALRHHLFHLGDECSGITGTSLRLGFGKDEHGQLGEPVSGQHVDGSAIHHFLCRAEAITVKATAVCDSKRSWHSRSIRRSHSHS